VAANPAPADQTLPRDPVEAAIVVAERFSRAFEERCNTNASAVARRLKDFPNVLLQAGLTPALTFYASKLDETRKGRIFIDVLKAVTGGGSGGEICKEATGEGGGYPHALAVLLAYIAGQAGCDVSVLLDGEDSGYRRGFVECVKAIKRGGPALERLALVYASEVKKLFAALYPSE